MAYLFGIVFAVFVLLVPSEAHASRIVASSGWNNLVYTICWSYGLIYIGVACRNSYKALRSKTSLMADASHKSGAPFFLFSAAYLMLLPFIQEALQGYSSGELDPSTNVLHTLLIFVVSGIALGAIFFPWLVLIFFKSFRHLRKQGITGLCLTPIIPALFGGYLFLYVF